MSQPAPETGVGFRHLRGQFVRLQVLYLEHNTSVAATSPELGGTSPISSLPSYQFLRIPQTTGSHFRNPVGSRLLLFPSLILGISPNL